jgi:phage-related protein
MAEREIKTTLALEGASNYKKTIEESARALKSMGLELKLNSSEAKLNGQSLDTLKSRQALLSDEVKKQKEYISALTQAVATSSEKYGANSKVTSNYKDQLTKANTALNAMEGEVKDTDQAIENFGKETQSTEKKTNDWRGSLEKVDQQLDKSIGFIGKVTAGIAAVGAAAIAAGKQLFDLTADTGKWADELITTSVQTGISTTSLQEWAYAAQFIDTEVETMTGSMAKMIKQMSAAKEGTGASAEAFATLGISLTNTDGSLRNSQVVFFEAIDALGKIANETDRDALSMQLFGKSAQELNPLIMAGSEQLRALGLEAQSMGIIMGEENVAKMGAFDDKMNVLNSTIGGMRNSIAVALSPAMEQIIGVIQRVADKFSEWLNSPAAQTLIGSLTDKIVALADNIGGNLDGVMNTIIGAFQTAGDVIGFVIKNIGTITTVVVTLTGVLVTLKIAQIAVNIAMAANPIGLIITAIGLLVTAIVMLIMNWDKVKVAISNVWESIKSAFEAGVRAVGGFISGIITWFGDLITGAWNAGRNLVSGLWDGIQSAAAWLWENITGWLGGIWKSIKGFFGISSPSKLMADTIGKPMAEGIASGLTKNLGVVGDAMRKIDPMLDMNVAAKAEQSVTANFSDSALARIVAGLASAINERDDLTIVLNDREFGRAVRKVAIA